MRVRVFGAPSAIFSVRAANKGQEGWSIYEVPFVSLVFDDELGEGDNPGDCLRYAKRIRTPSRSRAFWPGGFWG